jgi:dTDP-glucose pyrophosphorylase
MKSLEHLLVTPAQSIRDVMVCINQNAKGIALVVDEQRRLIGTITDGDIRGAVLKWVSLDRPVGELLANKTDPRYSQPITAAPNTEPGQLLRLMQEHSIRQIPIVETDGQVVDLVTLEELLPAAPAAPWQAVIMAGGFGTRLHPLTAEVPKPMLPLGDRPIIEHIVLQLREAGIQQMRVTTHYRPDQIKEHLGDGQKFGVEIDYVNEDRPLGTAGALGLMPPWRSTLLVINGDILTQLNYQSMLAFHRENKAVMTVGVRQYSFQMPYGVIETEGIDIRRVSEKPLVQFFVIAGVYLLEPAVHAFIPGNQRLDMPDLITRLMAGQQRIISFPINEYWLDIGQPGDYAKAQADMAAGELKGS